MFLANIFLTNLLIFSFHIRQDFRGSLWMDVLTKSLSSDTVDHFQLTRSHYLYINGSARHVFKSVMDLVLFYQKNHLPKKYCMLKFPIEIISRLDFIHRLPSPPQVKYMFRVKNLDQAQNSYLLRGGRGGRGGRPGWPSHPGRPPLPPLPPLSR